MLIQCLKKIKTANRFFKNFQNNKIKNSLTVLFVQLYNVYVI